MNKRITIDFSLKTVFTVVLSILILWLLYVLRDIIVIFFVAFFLATALEPMVNYLQKKHLPRIFSILLIYLVLAIVMYVLVRLIIPPIAVEIRHLFENREQIIKSVNSLIDLAPEGVKGAISGYGNSLPERISRFTVSSQALSSVMGLFSGFLGFVTILVIAFYLLLEKNATEKIIEDYWPISSRSQAKKIFRKMIDKVGLWAKGQLILSGSVSLLTYLGLLILGIPYAITLSLIAGLTELFPVIGPYLGAIPATIIAYSVSPLSVLWVVILYLTVQQLENHILVPQVMKRTVGLSPVAVILAILIGAKLLGILGIILAVPVASALMVLIQSLSAKEA